MKDKKYRPLFRTCLFFARLFSKKRKVEGEIPQKPCVFVCRHLDENGVARSFIDIKKTMRPWVLDIFTDYKSAKKQFKEYTFSIRLKKSKLYCAVVSPIVARGLTALVHSARGIPVYRKEQSSKSIQTIKQSVRALEEGDSIVIYADIDYASKDEKSEGEIYKGFSTVDAMFYKRNREHIPFVPVYIGKNKTIIHSPEFFEENREETLGRIKRKMFNETA